MNLQRINFTTPYHSENDSNLARAVKDLDTGLTWYVVDDNWNCHATYDDVVKMGAPYVTNIDRFRSDEPVITFEIIEEHIREIGMRNQPLLRCKRHNGYIFVGHWAFVSSNLHKRINRRVGLN